MTKYIQNYKATSWKEEDGDHTIIMTLVNKRNKGRNIYLGFVLLHITNNNQVMNQFCENEVPFKSKY
jgi:hypothetical protein